MSTSRRIRLLAACAVVLTATATTTAAGATTSTDTTSATTTTTATDSTATDSTGTSSAATLTPASANGTTGTDQDPLARFHSQRLHWHTCSLDASDALGRALDDAGAACADVTVPLDYTDPAGRTITVAVSRLKATDAAHRVGALLLNDGGPAGPSLHMPLTKPKVMGDVAGRYDLIGMDPRFVGRSTPLDCGWDLGSAFFRSAGSNLAAYRDEVTVARELAKQCKRAHGDVLPHVTTRNTARDMDVIRAALGEGALSYLGYSYGSYLGEVYTQLFPGRTDRMVLDGVNTPEQYNQTLLRGAETANEAALRAWASWAAARHDTFGLGATRGEVLATVNRILAAAAQEPLRIGTTYQLDEHVLPSLFVGGLGSDLDERRTALADTARILARAADRKPVEPSEALAGQLEFLLTGAGSAPSSQMTAILCGDVAERRGVGTYWRAVEKSRKVSSLTGPLANNITPCEFWDRPTEPPTQLDNDIPALLVNATGDPRTLYSGATAMRRQWPSSRLLTVQGARQHGLYGEYGNTCVDDHVNAYLRTGQLPTRDLTCQA
ncbi:alpha/beta hydrolase [Streptomyces wedmorensis]|uniref:alpha/beta hydrolase n=1 Tax=Streptomyces wedmorensis TaxID=43759 RepID=UPI0037A54432